MIPDWEANIVMISDVLPKRHPEIVHFLETLLHEHDIPLGIVPDMADIWIRDAAPVQVDEAHFLQFRYQADYLKGYEHLITKPEVFQKIDLFSEAERSRIILDGGNLVGTNSLALMTEKIYQENADWKRNDLRKELKRLLKSEHIILIPKEPYYDVFGHADGMVRFLSEDQVVVNDYSTVDPQFGTRFESILTRNGLQIIRLPYVPEQQTYDGIPSAVGNYVNFLQVRGLIALPAYGLPEDEVAQKILQNQIPSRRVVSFPCRELAQDGGIINCATWTGYQSPH